jgi:hypothetical protein
LWLSLLAASLITAVYALFVSWKRVDAPSRALFGHLLGVLGLILMLLTETVYSIRKSRQPASREEMTPWLQFHNFTGLVGPYLVILHSSWKFHGLAGATLFLTLIIVVSGVVGRYLYSWVGRRLKAVESEAASGNSHVAGLERARRVLAVWRVIHVTLGLALFLAAFTHVGAALYYATLLR